MELGCGQIKWIYNMSRIFPFLYAEDSQIYISNLKSLLYLSFNEYLLSDYHVPNSVLRAEENTNCTLFRVPYSLAGKMNPN